MPRPTTSWPRPFRPTRKSMPGAPRAIFAGRSSWLRTMRPCSRTAAPSRSRWAAPGRAWHCCRAVELAPNDLTIFRSYIEALSEAERRDEARRELAVARFRFERDSRFQKICHDFEFGVARDRQRQAGQAASIAVGESPAVLPFLHIHDAEARPVRARHFVRRDAATSQRPHFPRVIQQSDSSHAP